MSLLDILFPKFCINCHKFGSYLCASCFSYISFTDTGFCAVCQKAAIGGLTHPKCRGKYSLDGVFSSLVYQGVVKKLIYQFKYPPYITKLQPLLIDLFYEGLIQKEIFYAVLTAKSIFVPIPLHRSKFRKRGYNQAYLLGEGLGKRFETSVADCLLRIKNTKTQVGLSQKERQTNIAGAFSLKTSFDGQNVFLIDDVTTSGATLKEAAKIIKQAGAVKVWGLTLAHGQ